MEGIKNGNKPAQPFFEYNENGYGDAVCFYMPDGSKQIIPYSAGMSKRERMATDILAGILSKDTNHNIDSLVQHQVERALIYTDALLNALEIK